MNEEMLNMVPVTNSAKNTPEEDSYADAGIATGAANPLNSMSSTMKTKTMAAAIRRHIYTRFGNRFVHCREAHFAAPHEREQLLLHFRPLVAQVHAVVDDKYAGGALFPCVYKNWFNTSRAGGVAALV